MRFLEYTKNYSSNVQLATKNVTSLPANTWTRIAVSGTAVKSGERVIPQIHSTNQTTSTGNIVYDDVLGQHEL